MRFRAAHHQAPHERRVRFLDALATLAGFRLHYGLELPDGRKPDVLRLAPARHLLFLGDGKDAETPGCTATAARFHSYFKWLRTHVSERGKGAVFAICFGNPSHGDAWADMTLMLAQEVSVPVLSCRVTHFGEGFEVVWALLGDEPIAA